MDVGASEDGAFWLAFLRSLDRSGAQRSGAGNLRCSPGAEERHRRGVHLGPAGSAARTHFMANLLTRVPKRAQPGVATQDLLAWSAPSTSNCLLPRSTANWTEWWNNFGSPLPRWPTLLADAAAGHPGLHGLPSGPLAEAVVQQPAGTAEPGDKAPQSLPRKGTWWAFSPTGYRRGAWWARVLAEQHDGVGRSPPLPHHPQRRRQRGTADAQYAGRSGHDQHQKG